MKFNSKICALTAALALGAGMLVGCGNNGGGSKPEPTKYLVNVPTSTDVSFSGLNEDKQYEAGASVSFTVTLLNQEKEIVQVGYSIDSARTPLTPSGSTYSFTMPESNVLLYAQLKNVEHYVLSHEGTLQVDGDPVTFSLALGTDPITDFVLGATTGADKVTINGHSVTAQAQGDVTFTATVGGQVVAQEEVTVERSALYTLREAIDDAWENCENFDNNAESTKTETKYKVRANVVFMGTPFKSKVEMILDDGTALIDYQVASSSAITKFSVGDVIEIEEPLQNYYGLIEMYSSKVDYITVVEGETIPTTQFVDAKTGAEYDAVYNNNLVNQGEHKIVPVNIVAQTALKDDGTVIDNRYNVVGATAANKLIATTKSVISLEKVAGATYGFKGYLLNWNSSDTALYSNFVAIEQSRLQAQSVAIDQDDQEVAINNTLQLTYTSDPVGAGIEVSWTSDHPEIASVSETGLVTAKTAGTAVITLTVDGKTDTITITVPAALNPATAASFSKASEKVEIGKTLDLNELLTVTPADTTDAAVWSSDNADVASVADGVVTGVAKGDANIKVKFNDDVEATIAISVVPVHGTDITDPLTVDEAFNIGKGLPGENQKSVYSDEVYFVKGVLTGQPTVNDGKASLDNVIGGKIGLYNTSIGEFAAAAIEKGAEIIVQGQICNYSAGYKIQFAGQATIVSVDATVAQFLELNGEGVVSVGSTIQLNAVVYPASLSVTPTFTSSDESVATVTAAGVVSGVASGKVVITASYGTLESKTLSITVINGTLQNGTMDLSTLNSIVGTPTDNQIVWEMAAATLTNNKNDGTKVTNYYPGTSGKTYTQTRFYNKNSSIIAAKEGFEIIQVKFVCATEAYATAFAAFTFTNATATQVGSNVVLDLDNFAANVTWTNAATVGFTSVVVYYTAVNA